MLTFKTTKEGELIIDRVGFRTPVYLKPELAEEFRHQVFSLSDEQLITRLSDTESINYDVDKLNMAEDARETYNGTYSKGVRCFAIGLNMIKADAVPECFTQIYNDIVSYAKTYKNSTAWGETRTAHFNRIRDAIVSAFPVWFAGWMKEGFELKITAKAVNDFISKSYHTVNSNSKDSHRDTVYKTENPYKVFQFVMMSINTCTGVTRAEKSKKTINVF